MPRNPRPKKTKIELDLEQLEKLASIGATQREVALWFGIDINTVTRRFSKPEIRSVWDRGRARFHISLRRKQAELADKGNATMLIWLGKNELEQTDRLAQEVDVSGKIEVTPHVALAGRIDSLIAAVTSSTGDKGADNGGGANSRVSVAGLLGKRYTTPTGKPGRSSRKA